MANLAIMSVTCGAGRQGRGSGLGRGGVQVAPSWLHPAVVHPGCLPGYPQAGRTLQLCTQTACTAAHGAAALQHHRRRRHPCPKAHLNRGDLQPRGWAALVGKRGPRKALALAVHAPCAEGEEAHALSGAWPSRPYPSQSDQAGSSPPAPLARAVRQPLHALFMMSQAQAHPWWRGCLHRLQPAAGGGGRSSQIASLQARRACGAAPA